VKTNTDGTIFDLGSLDLSVKSNKLDVSIDKYEDVKKTYRKFDTNVNSITNNNSVIGIVGTNYNGMLIATNSIDFTLNTNALTKLMPKRVSFFLPLRQYSPKRVIILGVNDGIETELLNEALSFRNNRYRYEYDITATEIQYDSIKVKFEGSDVIKVSNIEIYGIDYLYSIAYTGQTEDVSSIAQIGSGNPIISILDKNDTITLPSGFSAINSSYEDTTVYKTGTKSYKDLIYSFPSSSTYNTDLQNDYTMSFWIRRRDTSNDKIFGTTNYWQTSTSNFGFGLYSVNWFFGRSGVSGYFTLSPKIDKANVWYHLTLVKKATNDSKFKYTLYTREEDATDFHNEVSETSAYNTNDTNILFGGSSHQDNNPFAGYFDDFKFFNTALTKTEVEQLINDTYTGVGPDILTKDGDKLTVNLKAGVAVSAKVYNITANTKTEIENVTNGFSIGLDSGNVGDEFFVELTDASGTVYNSNKVNVSDVTPASTEAKIIAFHHDNFDNVYSDGTKEDAVANGHVYADTPTGSYSWGTLDSVVLDSDGSVRSTTYIWTPSGEMTADVLMVAGGGAGGSPDNANGGGGGGGAGGLMVNTDVSISGTKTIVVGHGGRAMDTSGHDTSFTGLTTVIRGGAGRLGTGHSGGSGGGAGRNYAGGSGTPGQGHNGGSGTEKGDWMANSNQGGSGGGGAGGPGIGANGGNGANGGPGVDLSATFGTTYGDDGHFASGGGGGYHSGSNGIGPIGGGGNGGATDHGQNHTGGGGGGARLNSNDTIGLGGSGIVLIKYSINADPKLTFGNFNKLTIENITGTLTKINLTFTPDGSTTSQTIDVGTATSISISQRGKYKAQIITDTGIFITDEITVESIQTGAGYTYKVIGTWTSSNWPSSGLNVYFNELELYDDDNNIITLSNGSVTIHEDTDVTVSHRKPSDAIYAITDGCVSSTPSVSGEAGKSSVTNSFINYYASTSKISSLSELNMITFTTDRKVKKANFYFYNSSGLYPKGLKILLNNVDHFETTDMTFNSTGLGTTYGWGKKELDLSTSINGLQASFAFDTYNKLTIENTPVNATTTLKFTPTGSTETQEIDIGTATSITITQTGTYSATIKSADSFTITDEIIVGTLGTFESLLVIHANYNEVTTLNGGLKKYGDKQVNIITDLNVVNVTGENNYLHIPAAVAGTGTQVSNILHHGALYGNGNWLQLKSATLCEVPHIHTFMVIKIPSPQPLKALWFEIGPIRGKVGNYSTSSTNSITFIESSGDVPLTLTVPDWSKWFLVELGLTNNTLFASINGGAKTEMTGDFENWYSDTISGVHIGNAYLQADHHGNFHLGEFKMYNKNLTDAERGDVMSKLNDTWGFTTASLGGQSSFVFDGYNKLTIENAPANATTTLKFTPTGSTETQEINIGTATSITINETGTYSAIVMTNDDYIFTNETTVDTIITPPYTWDMAEDVESTVWSATWFSISLESSTPVGMLSKSVVQFMNTYEEKYAKLGQLSLQAGVVYEGYVNIFEQSGWYTNHSNGGTIALYVSEVDTRNFQGVTVSSTLVTSSSRSSFDSSAVSVSFNTELVNRHAQVSFTLMAETTQNYYLTLYFNMSGGTFQSGKINIALKERAPSLSFSNDKLILSGLPSDHTETIIEKKDGASVNVGNATDIIPSEQGEYRAVIKSTSSWTFTEYVNVGALGSPPTPLFTYDSDTYKQFGFYYTYDSIMSKSYISPDGSKVFVNKKGHVSPSWYYFYSSYDFNTKTETQHSNNFNISSQAHAISNDTLIVPRNSTVQKLTSTSYSSLDSIDTSLGSINNIYGSFNVSFDENNTTVISLCRNTSNKYMITEFKRTSSTITARLVKDITDEIPSTSLYFYDNEQNGTYDVISGYTGSITIYRYSVTNKTDLEIELKETIVMNSLPYTNNYYRPMGKRFMIHDNNNQVTIYNADMTVFASNTNIRNGQSNNKGPDFWTIDDRYFGVNFSRGAWMDSGGGGWQGITQYVYIYDSHDISSPDKVLTKGAFGSSYALWANQLLGAYIKVHNGEIVHFWSNQHYAYVQKMKIYENPTYFL
tara:strand:- start:1647 stop:7784 length:6138 start_codon:yes stop_codon:yes gene_type:complete